jgi:hypothetical protein
MSTLEERAAMPPIKRWFHYLGMGYASIFEGMLNIFSFGQYQYHDPEVEAILARSDRDALFDDWKKVTGDFEAVGLSMNHSLSWMTAEVEKARIRGDSVDEMVAAIFRRWNEDMGVTSSVPASGTGDSGNN